MYCFLASKSQSIYFAAVADAPCPVILFLATVPSRNPFLNIQANYNCHYVIITQQNLLKQLNAKPIVHSRQFFFYFRYSGLCNERNIYDGQQNLHLCMQHCHTLDALASSVVTTHNNVSIKTKDMRYFTECRTHVYSEVCETSRKCKAVNVSNSFTTQKDPLPLQPTTAMC